MNIQAMPWQTPERSFEEAKLRCQESSPDEEVILKEFYHYETFFDVNKSKFFGNRQDLKERSEWIYREGYRLPLRSYFDRTLNEFVIPFTDQSGKIHRVPFSEKMIANVLSDIELALKMKVAEFIFFSDMGHLHFIVPRKSRLNQKLKQEKKDGDWEAYFQNLFGNNNTRMVYHTAESLMMSSIEHSEVDPIEYRLFRHMTRNIVGNNSNYGINIIQKEQSLGYNTVRASDAVLDYYDPMPNSNLYFSANQDGCFPSMRSGIC